MARQDEDGILTSTLGMEDLNRVEKELFHANWTKSIVTDNLIATVSKSCVAAYLWILDDDGNEVFWRSLNVAEWICPGEKRELFIGAVPSLRRKVVRFAYSWSQPGHGYSHITPIYAARPGHFFRHLGIHWNQDETYEPIQVDQPL
jgi:hypothetical protein